MDLFEIFKWTIGIIIVVASLYFSIRQFRVSKTIAYIERFNSPSMIGARSTVKKWSELNNEQKIQKLKEDTDLYYKVGLFYNLITEIGISYKYRVISRKITHQIFDPLIPNYYLDIEPYIWLNMKNEIKMGWYARYIYDLIIKNRKKNTKIYKPTIFQLSIDHEKL